MDHASQKTRTLTRAAGPQSDAGRHRMDRASTAQGEFSGLEA